MKATTMQELHLTVYQAVKTAILAGETAPDVHAEVQRALRGGLQDTREHRRRSA